MSSNAEQQPLIPVELPAQEDSNKWLLKELSEKHKDAAALLAQGLKHVEVAAAVGFHPHYITMLLRQPLFIAYVEEMTAAASVRMEALYQSSVNVVAETLLTGSEDGRLKAAKLQMEATGRIGSRGEGTKTPPGDKLPELAERLVSLLQTQRKRVVNGEVTDVEVVQDR